MKTVRLLANVHAVNNSEFAAYATIRLNMSVNSKILFLRTTFDNLVRSLVPNSVNAIDFNLSALHNGAVAIVLFYPELPVLKKELKDSIANGYIVLEENTNFNSKRDYADKGLTVGNGIVTISTLGFEFGGYFPQFGLTFRTEMIYWDVFTSIDFSEEKRSKSIVDIGNEQNTR